MQDFLVIVNQRVRENGHKLDWARKRSIKGKAVELSRMCGEEKKRTRVVTRKELSRQNSGKKFWKRETAAEKEIAGKWLQGRLRKIRKSRV